MSWKQTTKSGSESTRLKSGDIVIIKREEPAKGTWNNYAGKVGVVRTVNLQTIPEHNWSYVELGIQFSGAHKVTWFRADEVIYSPDDI